MDLKVVWELEGSLKTDLIIGECAVLVDGVDLSNFASNRFTLKHSLLLTLREQRYLVVHIFHHNKYGRLRSKLLSSIILKKKSISKDEYIKNI